ncbi:MAG TPA: methyltransferase domain-containing protein [Longimicrobiaceae bacterium]
MTASAAPLAGRAPWLAGLSRTLLALAARLPGISRAAWVRRRARPAVGRVRLGDLRRVGPLRPPNVSIDAEAVDRRYADAFLREHAGRLRGRVLAVGEVPADVLPASADVVRLAVGEAFPDDPHAPPLGEEAFDTIVLGHALHRVYDVWGAAAAAGRALRPGGALLLTVPGLAPMGADPEWCWSFTAQAVERLLATAMPDSEPTVESRGNVLAAAALLQGVPARGLRPAELAEHDPLYPVVVAALAVRPPCPPRG